MISIHQVSKVYGDARVVDKVSLQLAKGAITSIIGPNGAGKSTLISMISRLTDVDEGEIYIDGRELRQFDNNELAKRISILKQSNHVNLRLTIRDLVVFGRFPYSQGRFSQEDWAHAERAIRFMGLEHLQHKYLDQLSGGERQRAFFAMVIAQDTDYILLDEPLNNLDMKQAVQVMKTLRRLVSELGKTIVIVLHDINFASFYSDYIVAMKGGRVVRSGSTDEIIHSQVLRDIYDMDIRVENINRHKVCMYFT